MTLKNYRAPVLSTIKLYASFHHHMWIQTGVTVRKRLSGVMTSVTLTFDLWPWPFAWTLRSSLVITPENFMMIRWWEHSQKGVTDRRTDGQTDRQTENTICRAAWSQLKTTWQCFGRSSFHLKMSLWKSAANWAVIVCCWCFRYSDVIMGTMASQITSLTIVYSTVYSSAHQRKHQSIASQAFVRGIHRWPVNFPHKWPVTRKMFLFDDVIIVLRK